jgi:hypothetical protein
MKGDYHMTADEITAQVAAIHASIDDKITGLCDDLLELERLVSEGVKIGMVKPLAGKRAIREVQSLRGAAADVGLNAADVHIYHHKVAKDASIPTPDLSTVAGVTVMGPGR